VAVPAARAGRAARRRRATVGFALLRQRCGLAADAFGPFLSACQPFSWGGPGATGSQASPRPALI